MASATYRVHGARGFMHTVLIKLGHALFIGPAARTYAVVVRIVLWPANNGDRGIQRVSALRQPLIAIVNVVVSVGGADDHVLAARSGARRRTGCGCLCLRGLCNLGSGQ